MIMKYVRYIAAAFLLSASTLMGVAQTAKSAYFLDGAYHNYLLNPAMNAERGFFTILGGNFSLATNGNVGISNFIYPYGEDKLTTFMSGTVNQNEFLGNLPKAIRLSTDIDMTLLAGGFRMLGGYTTMGLTLSSHVSTNIPRGLFEFAKKGFQQSSYSFSDLNLRTMNYLALTVGHSREVIDGLRVGMNAKFLMGLAYANVHIDKLNVELSENRWMVESHAAAQAALFAEARLTANESGTVDNVELPILEAASFKPAASGFAVDLGAVYDMNDLVEGLSVSASVVDMGLLNWKYMMKASTRETKVEFDGFTEIDPNDFEGSVEDELNQLGKDAEKMLEFYSNGVSKSSTGLGATMYLGAEYCMPFYKPLSAALLYGKRFGQFGGWNDFRAYVNVAPLNWVEASANLGFSTFGTSFGWMLNIHPVGFNFFIGSDYMITRVTPQFIPVNNMNGHVTFGINFPIGERR